jgi:glycosyltransferase involved in cell wall biosynthesis
VHQFRQAYELDGTALGQFSDSPEDRAIRRKVQALDRVALGEASRLFAISQNVANPGGSLDRAHGGGAAAPAAGARVSVRDYGDFVLSVNRLDRAKRIDLLIEAAASDGSLQIVIAGEGPDRERLERLARDRGLNGRARFTGRVGESELADLYARCLAVYYAPVDEDYGMVPLEAFLSEKPVLTTTDAGGPLEVVSNGSTGPRRHAGRRRDRPRTRLAPRASRRSSLLRPRGKAIASEVTWDRAIGRLLS